MSGGDNLPDDWGCYYTHCDLCGARYHMSEGGCSCMDDADDCACGRNEWTRDDDRIICFGCRTEPGTPPETEDDE